MFILKGPTLTVTRSGQNYMVKRTGTTALIACINNTRGYWRPSYDKSKSITKEEYREVRKCYDFIRTGELRETLYNLPK